MRTQDEHLKQASDNETFAEQLLQSAEPISVAWAVTVLFYTVVHYGRAFLAASGTPDFSTHRGFESLFRQSWQGSPQVISHYLRLKDHSASARYECVSYNERQVRTLKDREMVPFRDAIKATLGVQ